VDAPARFYGRKKGENVCRGEKKRCILPKRIALQIALVPKTRGTGGMINNNGD